MKNHRSIEELVSRSLDGELTAGESQRLEAALEENPELRALAEDLALLKALAPRIHAPGPPPDDRLLRARVERRYAAPAGRKKWVIGYRGLAWAALILGFVVLLPLLEQGFREMQGRFSRDPNQREATPPAYPPDTPLALVQAQVQFHRQAAVLENLALFRLTQSGDPGAVTWARDFHKLNRTIAEMEELCRNFPDRPGHYAALGRIYQTKIDLLVLYLAATEEIV